MNIVLAFIFGLIIGSFLNVVIWRLPRKESLSGRSHCPHCGHTLKWHDLMPLLSIALQGGRCKYCRSKISLRYPFIETLVGTLFALAMWLFPVTDLISALFFLKLMIVVAVCVVVFVIDLEHYLILNRIVYPAIGAMLVLDVALGFLRADYSSFLYSVLGALVAGGIFWLLWYGSKFFRGETGLWMGFGDVKFVIFMALALGFPAIVIGLFLSFMAGAIIGVGLIVVGHKQFSSRLPFGTFLSIATLAALFWGTQLWDLYWGLFSLA